MRPEPGPADKEHTLAEHELENVRRCATQRDPDANLPRALRDLVLEQPVEPSAVRKGANPKAVDSCADSRRVDSESAIRPSMVRTSKSGSSRLRRSCGTMDVVNGDERPVLTAIFSIALGAALLIADASPAAQSGSFVDNLLRREMRFSAADLRALHAGSAVVESLDTPVRQELAHFGAVYVEAPTGRFIERFRDIERFESGPGIPQIGRFGSPPRLEDLASLTLPADEVSELATCRPGDCDVKLSAAAMKRFRTRVNWSSPNTAREVNEVAREMILELVHAYQAQGNAALGHYDDGSEPLPVAEQFRALLASSNRLPVPVPELMAYLDEYPRGRPAGAEDFFYWSVVDFGLKPTIRVNHVIMYPLADSPLGVSHVIAIKQLYASHYFHTTLELRFLVGDDRSAIRHDFYLLSITRSRSDGMTGLKGLLARPIIRRRSRSAVRVYLEHVKRQVERPAAAAVVPFGQATTDAPAPRPGSSPFRTKPVLP